MLLGCVRTVAMTFTPVNRRGQLETMSEIAYNGRCGNEYTITFVQMSEGRFNSLTYG